MSVLVLVLYVALGIAALALVPGIFVVVREALRRRRARRALERLAAAREEIDRLRREPLSRVVRTLSQKFDRRTIQAAMEQALGEAARSAELCESLGLRAAWEQTLREGRAWNERAHAARMLGKLGVASASPALVSALVDPHEDTTVRLAASEALGAILDEAVVPHLCEALRSQGEESAPCVAEALVSFGRTAVGPVVELLGDHRPSARTWAARVLGRIGEPAGAMPLVGRLGDASAPVRAAAVEALGRIGDARASRPLVCAALGDPSPAVRAHAASALARAGDEEAVAALVEGLGDADAHVRSRAIEALSSLQPKDRSPIERALFDPSADVRRSAALTLDRMGVVSVWAAALGSAAADARAAARAALVSVGRAGLSEAIAAATQHEDGTVRAGLYGVLGELGAARHVPVLSRALEDPAAQVRQSAALAIGRIGGDAAKELLCREKPDGIVEVAWIVARALAGDTAWVEVARMYVANSEGDAAAQAVCAAEGEAISHAFAARVGVVDEEARSLRETSTARWVAEARRAARVEDRLRALGELMVLSGPEVTAALAEVVVSDPSPEARALAARGLARASERWLCVPALVRALSDPAQDVVLEASRALGHGPTGEKKGKRSSDAPADINGAARRTTGRLRREEMQARESVA